MHLARFRPVRIARLPTPPEPLPRPGAGEPEGTLG